MEGDSGLGFENSGLGFEKTGLISYHCSAPVFVRTRLKSYAHGVKN